MNPYGNKYVAYFVWRFILRNPKLRLKLQKLIYPSGTVAINLLGQQLTIDAQKELGYLRAARVQQSSIVFRDEVPQMLSLASIMRNGTIFVDVGANVGLWSCLFASLDRLHGNIRVIAFEPNPDTYQRLQANTGQYENIVTHNVALSDRDQELDFFSGAVSGVFSSHPHHFHTGESVRLQAKPLDSYLSNARDIVMKIDAEGHEHEILLGAEESFQAGRVRAVFIDGFARTQKEVLAFLERHKFRCLDARSRKPFDADEGVALLALSEPSTHI